MLQPIHWSPKLGATGEKVTGVDDIAQCMMIILTTMKGSDPLRPLFGSGHFEYLDSPLPFAAPYIIREVWDAIATWEPRCVVESVVPLSDGEHLYITIYWHPVDGVKTEVLRIAA